MPKVSVIIPVYNVEKYLRKCLDSVVGQTLKDIEIICVDDGSTDGSGKILDEYAKKNGRIKVIAQKNSGAGTARNAGLDVAKGEYVTFMDPDDFYPDKNVIIELYNSAVTHKANICGGSLCLFMNGKIKKSSDAQYVFNSNGFVLYKDYQYEYGFTRFIYNREFLKRNKIRFPSYRRVEDPPFFIKAMSLAEKFYALKKNVYLYRTSHKTIKWTADMVADTLKGIYECLQMAQKNKYTKLENRIISRLNTNYMLNIVFPFHKDNEVIKALRLLEKNYKDALNPLYYAYKYPSISIIIPVYNVEKYLRKCLNSVLAQTLKDIEIICIDDGSTDGSGKILDEYAKKDKRIMVVHQDNQGLSCSRNNAMKIAQGEYILFLDSDDYIREDTCEILFKQALAHNLDMLSFSGINFDNNSGKLQKNTYYQFNYLPKNFDTKCFNYKQCTQFITKMAVSACLTFYRRKFLEQNHIAFPPHLFFEDNVFYTHALLKAERCGICREMLYFRRVHPESVTQNWNKHFSDYLQICQKVIDLVRNLPISDEIKVKYYQSYTNNPANIYARFDDDDKKKYKNQLYEFLQKNHIKSITKYKLFGFVPLVKIETV